MNFYRKMEELQEKLRRSEEERQLLQRQYDLMVQAGREKDRSRVAAVEARYKRFLDDDKRRRDRNSSLLQALDRIDSHTANLAAKTERMRLLRKHYEAFIAHAGWPMHIDCLRYPLAPLTPTHSIMGRTSEVSGYGTETQLCLPEQDYSVTQYRELPKISVSSLGRLTTPLCRSELSISSREDYSPVRRSLCRGGSSAYRSASLSPSRVRDLSPRYDFDKVIAPREYESVISPKGFDSLTCPKAYDPIICPKAYESVPSPRYSNHYSESRMPPLRYEGKYHIPKTVSSTKQYFVDGDRGNSDIEGDQNTSRDLLNLSLSDDGILNDHEVVDTPVLDTSHRSYSSPYNSDIGKKSMVALSEPVKSSLFSPRELYLDSKRNEMRSPVHTSENIPMSVLSPRESYIDTRKTDLPSSVPMSDSVQRILLSPEDPYLDVRRSDIPLSPRRHRPSWQTLRHSYLQQPRSTARRTVTFNEPELGQGDAFSRTENKYLRDDSPHFYSGSYSSLRRQSPSLAAPSSELTDHERYLRDKQGREKDAFQEKIQRLKELIQENKEQEKDMTDTFLDNRVRRVPSLSKSDVIGKQLSPKTEYVTSTEEKESAESSDPGRVTEEPRLGLGKEFSKRKEQMSISRRPSTTDEPTLQSRKPSVDSTALSCKSSTTAEEVSNQLQKNRPFDDDPISDKEQWSGQFNEKDEDMKNNHKVESQDTILSEKEITMGKLLSEKQDEQTKPQGNGPELYTLSQSQVEQKHELPSQEHQDGKKEEDPESLDLGYQPKTEHEQEQKVDYYPQEQQPGLEHSEHYSYQQGQQPMQDPGYQQEEQNDQSREYGYEPEKPRLDYGYQQGQQPQQNENVDYAYHPDQQLQESVEYNYQQEQQPNQEQDVDYSYQQSQELPQEQSIDYNYQQDQQPAQDSVEYYQQSQQPQQEPNVDYNYQDQQPQPEQDGNYNYQQDLQPAHEQNADYSYPESQQPGDTVPEDKLTYQQSDGYGASTQPPEDYSQEYDTFDQGAQEPVQKQEEYGEQTAYNSYPKDTPTPQQPGDYVGQEPYPQEEYAQEQSESQYPQQYQEYQQDNQYTPLQEGGDYQYQQDPSAAGYPGGEYSYPQDTAYNYQQNPPDQQYQQDDSYQQNQTYPPESYQGTGYEYGQQGPEDQSESSDSRYQPSDGNLQSTDQYHNLLGGAGASDPAYSDSSEIENQMAAVVGQEGGIATRIPEQSQQEYSHPAEASSTGSAPALASASATAPVPAPAPATGPGKGKVTTKKRPLLTRKQSTVSSENADGKQASAAPALSKMLESDSESAPVVQGATHDDSSDFDISSAQ